MIYAVQCVSGKIPIFRGLLTECDSLNPNLPLDWRHYLLEMEVGGGMGFGFDGHTGH